MNIEIKLINEMNLKVQDINKSNDSHDLKIKAEQLIDLLLELEKHTNNTDLKSHCIRSKVQLLDTLDNEVARVEYDYRRTKSRNASKKRIGEYGSSLDRAKSRINSDVYMVVNYFEK